MDVITNLHSVISDILLGSYHKSQLRKAVMQLPIDDNFPYDLELRMLTSTDLVNGPMLDIGANTGIYSAVLEAQVGPCNLYLFEPLPVHARRLGRRFRRSHVFKMAISDEIARTTIRIPLIDGHPIETRTTLNHHIEDHQTGELPIDCEISTLDAVIPNLELNKISFIKIDVEGHELHVLRGARQVLNQYRPIILMEAEARHHTFPMQLVFDELLNRGYHGYFLRSGPFELSKLDQFDENKDQNLENHRARLFLRYFNNFFFVPVENEVAFVQKATAFLDDCNARAV